MELPHEIEKTNIRFAEYLLLKTYYLRLMLVKTFGSAVYGIDAVTITVETFVGAGEPKYFMVGMPDQAVKESLFRIEAALKNIERKMSRQKLLVSLAPADIRKEGSA